MSITRRLGGALLGLVLATPLVAQDRGIAQDRGVFFTARGVDVAWSGGASYKLPF